MSTLSHDPLNIIVTGVGGQGNVLASQVLGRALLDAGWVVTVGETYGLSQRGGAVMSMVRVSRDQAMGPLIPENQATAIVSLEPLEALRVLPQYGHPEVVVITNDRPLLPINVISGQARYPDLAELQTTLGELSGRLLWVPATNAALELGSPILANVVMMGALAASGLLPIGLKEIEAGLAQMFTPAKMAPNREALQRGWEMVLS